MAYYSRWRTLCTKVLTLFPTYVYLLTLYCTRIFFMCKLAAATSKLDLKPQSIAHELSSPKIELLLFTNPIFKLLIEVRQRG